MTTVRRHAWWYLVALSVLLALFGVTDVLGGASADPGIARGLAGSSPAELEVEAPAAYRLFDFATRTQGLLLVVAGILLTTILLIPYRRGERWAWLVMWLLPSWSFAVLGAYLVAGIVPGEAPPPPMISGPILGGLAAVVLLIDRVRFRGQPERAATAAALGRGAVALEGGGGSPR